MISTLFLVMHALPFGREELVSRRKGAGEHCLVVAASSWDRELRVVIEGSDGSMGEHGQELALVA